MMEPVSPEEIITQLLPFLPKGNRYRLTFMERPLNEVLGSQQAMLERSGAESGDAATLAATFQRHLDLCNASSRGAAMWRCCACPIGR